MSERITMPHLGETVTEGTILRWLVNVGDSIKEDDPILEISTDKVDTEVPSPFSGTVSALLVEEGETVEVGLHFLSLMEVQKNLVMINQRQLKKYKKPLKRLSKKIHQKKMSCQKLIMSEIQKT